MLINTNNVNTANHKKTVEKHIWSVGHNIKYFNSAQINKIIHQSVNWAFYKHVLFSFVAICLFIFNTLYILNIFLHAFGIKSDSFGSRKEISFQYIESISFDYTL